MRLSYLALILICAGCAKPKPPQALVLQGDAFGTTYAIQFYSENSFDAEKGLDSVFYAVNRSVSTYMPGSDISKINNGDSTIVVDKIFKDVFLLSEEVYRISEGYFDPTVGVLRNAYGFGDVTPLERIDDEILDSLMEFVGFQKVKLTSENKIQKEHPNIYFDFNAVAKGYGIDCIGNYLESQGVSNYLIELGGEILARGTNLEKEKPWVVGIEAVESQLENRSYQATVEIRNMGMASSGNYRKFRIDSLTGQKYVHTINPLNGSAEKSDVTSATVLAATCAEADAYATACMALGVQGSKRMLEKLPGVEVYLTYNDSLGAPQVYMTSGFSELLAD